METLHAYNDQPDLLQDSFDAPVYAGFWLRFAAYIIDAIMMYAIIFVVALVFGLGGALEVFENEDLSALTIVTLAVIYIALLMYFPILESSKLQATLGKKAVGIKVTDLDGNRIGFGRALGRFFGKILSGIILYIGFMMAGFTEKKQALHDMIAGTLVVKA